MRCRWCGRRLPIDRLLDGYCDRRCEIEAKFKFATLGFREHHTKRSARIGFLLPIGVIVLALYIMLKMKGLTW